MKFHEDLEAMDDGIDSDEELQQAFQSGKLKPGINIVKDRLVERTINNEKGLLAKLDQFRVDLSWLERLDLTCSAAPLAPELRQQMQLNDTFSVSSTSVKTDNLAEDDFKRETYFYRISQAAVLEGIPRLHQLDISTKRPDDYLAQMVKSDQQMDKVRKFVLQQKTRKEMSEKARKMRAMKKHGKQTQVEALQRKAKEKREMLDQVKKFRKGKEKSLDFLDDLKENNKKGQKKRSVSRQRRDEQYGHGGRKRGQKRNSASSAADMSWVKQKKNKRGGADNRSRAGGSSASGSRPTGPHRKKQIKQKRPGKMARKARKNKK